MFKMSPVFRPLVVAKPLVTEGTNECQMKDMDPIFPLWYGYTLWFTVGPVVWLPQPLKVEQFFEMFKNAVVGQRPIVVKLVYKVV